MRSEYCSRMTIEFDLTAADLSAFNLYHHKHSPTARKHYYRSWFIPPSVWLLICLGLCFLLVSVKRISYLEAFINLWPLFCGVLVHVMIFPWWYERRVRKIVTGMIAEGKNRGLLCRHRVTISPENIVRTGDYGKNSTNWSAVERIVVTKEQALVYLNSMSAVVIPRRAFATTSAFDEFVHVAQGFHQKFKA